ncbi:MAG: hypothetical protein KDE19_07675 [Caldilineaceae bacterium]|nr:hypothetical protein [Caldilineaceae bacterium]
MLDREKWPFPPIRLSAIIDKETLSVIEAGCAERLGRARTIIDYDADQPTALRTDPINPRQNFEAHVVTLGKHPVAVLLASISRPQPAE